MKYIYPFAIVSLVLLASCTKNDQTYVSPEPSGQNISQEKVSVDTTEQNAVQTENEEGVLVGGAMMLPSKDIVDNAVEANNVTTLVAAVQAAGLVETLKSAGPFTVFAPTNDAFAKLPEGTVESLLEPENIETLTSILTYHVVSGSYTSSDLEDGLVLTSVQGETLEIEYSNDVWTINGAEIQIADVISSNGVTHVIDTVLRPEASQ